MSWTDERIERLKKMWSQGATASQIADELGGVSRNAVIGKAHRLGLEQRPSPVKPGEEKEAKKPAAARGRQPRNPLHRRPRPQGPLRRPLPQHRPRPLRRRAPALRCSIARSAPAASFARVRAISRLRSRPLPLAASCRPSRARRLPTRRASSISTIASASGRWATPASQTSISAASRPTRASLTASSIAESPTRLSFRAAIAVRRRRSHLAGRGSAKRLVLQQRLRSDLVR